MSMKARLLALMLIVSAAAAVVPGHAATGCDPKNPPAVAKTQDLPGFGGIIGHYVAPREAPTALVAFFHGYRNRSDSWVCHMIDAAAHGALAFGLDYRGTGYTGAAADNRGWFVKEGAQDSVDLANYFIAQHPSITTVVSFGVSMGGNASGLAVALKNNPFDYWVDVEGATSTVETYLEATAVGALGNVYAAGAQQDIEAECKGTIYQAPDCYRDISVVTHTADIAALKGAFMSHGIDDGLVPHNQSEEMAAALRAAGVPVDYYAVARRNGYQDPSSADDEGGTTLSENAATPLFTNAGLGGYTKPLAGHGWEGSDTQLVIATGFKTLYNLLDHATAPANHEFIVDSELGTTQIV